MGQMRWNDDFSGTVEEPDRLQPKQFGPDAALQDRLLRRDAQRGMFKNRIAPTRAAAHATTDWDEGAFSSLEERGIPSRAQQGTVPTLMQHGIPAPADNTPWTKFGISHFFNRDELSSAQNFVFEDRVKEIRENPALGQNPRFPANHEKPHIAVVANRPDMPRGYEGVIMNGNHRVAAELDKGALFIEGKSIVADETSKTQVREFNEERLGRQSRLNWTHTPHEPKIKLREHR